MASTPYDFVLTPEQKQELANWYKRMLYPKRTFDPNAPTLKSSYKRKIAGKTTFSITKTSFEVSETVEEEVIISLTSMKD